MLTRNSSQSSKKRKITTFLNDHMIINFYTYAKKRLSSKIHEHIRFKKKYADLNFAILIPNQSLTQKMRLVTNYHITCFGFVIKRPH